MVVTSGCHSYVVWWILLAVIDMLCGGYWWLSLVCYVVLWLLVAVIGMLCGGYWRLSLICCDGYIWRCSNKRCKCKISIRKDSWFSGSHLSIPQILKLTYFWVYKIPQNFAQQETRIGSNNTLVDWHNFAREVCALILDQDDDQIGGEGEIVELDESKFGKQKFHKHRRVIG